MLYTIKHFRKVHFYIHLLQEHIIENRVIIFHKLINKNDLKYIWEYWQY